VVVLREAAMRRLIAISVSSVVLVAGVGAGLAGMQEERRVIAVRAERFSFSPSEIVLEAGEEVEFRITSDDTAHGFHIRGTATNVTIPKRGQGTASVVVRFDQPGRYTFECSRMCGAGHHFMRGDVLVRDSTAGASRP
jgi:cytochrome c oxidase subunit 2